jgi:predicted GNAT family acetyltransferase
VTDTNDVTVSDNPSELRYELRRAGELLGEIRYRREPDALVLLHTEVAPALEGGGYGELLVRRALDAVRARGLRIVPLCPFVGSFLRRHPEYDDLVVGDPALPE